MAAQFQVRHLLLSDTQAARHTPSPQHTGLNPNTPSNASRWERLQSSHFFDDFFSPSLSLCLVPSAHPSSVFQMEAAHAQLPPNTQTHTYARLNTRFRNVLLFALSSIYECKQHFWDASTPSSSACLCLRTLKHRSVLILGYQVCLICLLESAMAFRGIK